MLKTQIKASQITNLTDARYFAAWGVHWIGFDLQEGNDTYVPPASLLGIRDWIEGPKIIGEYHISSVEGILTTAEQLGLDGVQVGPFFPADELASLKSIVVIQKVVIEPDTQPKDIEAFLKERADHVQHFLFDYSSNGINWTDLQNQKTAIGSSELAEWAKSYAILLDIQFPADQYEQLLDLGIVGFSVKGGEEEKVGLKSFDELDELFEAIAPE